MLLIDEENYQISSTTDFHCCVQVLTLNAASGNFPDKKFGL